MARNPQLHLVTVAAAVVATCWPSGGCSSDDAGAEHGDAGRGDAGSEQPLVHYSQQRQACSGRDANRRLFWGDLHVHTRLSFDAYTYRTRTTPAQAFAFARGEPVWLPPLDADGNGTREVSLSRPLDFAALTDHQEYLAEVHLCTEPDSELYDTPFCTSYRQGGDQVVTDFGTKMAVHPPQRFQQVCAQPGIDCGEVAERVWQSIVSTAEQANDTSSACAFTAFVGYEYTGNANISNNHRNVIFRNADVPSLPPSFFETAHEEGLWEALGDSCREELDACDYIAIPHNANWSAGNMFSPQTFQDLSDTARRDAHRQRVRSEPLIEIHQHKGDMECKNGFEGAAVDPLCDFEKLWPDFVDCGDTPGSIGFLPTACRSRFDYLRGILGLGLVEYSRVGVNPFKLGVIASTDTHNGIAGRVSEHDWPGHVGVADDTPQKRLGIDEQTALTTYDDLAYNPGGLTAVWAVENSRDALFEAFLRRETYSSSGPRIAVRFFGGWNYEEEICDEQDVAPAGYAGGVPMGGDLPPNADGERAPVLVVWAQKDPGSDEHPGADLQQIQIIKGWIDQNGTVREKVHLAAGDPENSAAVDRETCARTGSGAQRLCAAWTDPDFDPDTPAFYYARVVENPSCSWRQYDCNRLSERGIDASDVCTTHPHAPVIQQRAVTSSIWYEPDG